VQSAAGAASLGTGAASVQFSRSLGSAFGTALVGATFFTSLGLSDPGAMHAFVTIIEGGPATLASLPHADQASITADVSSAFRAAFVAMALMATAALGFAWSLPVRRL
jgi:hypothetical protein